MLTPEQKAISHLSDRLLVLRAEMDWILQLLHRIAPAEVEQRLQIQREIEDEIVRGLEPDFGGQTLGALESSIEHLEDAIARSRGITAIKGKLQL